MLLLVFKEAYVRKTLWEFQLKMLSGSLVIQLFLSQYHPNCQLANELDWQKQVKLQLDIITFEVVKIFSLNFQDFLSHWIVWESEFGRDLKIVRWRPSKKIVILTWNDPLLYL